jgi:hypothetical protein
VCVCVVCVCACVCVCVESMRHREIEFIGTQVPINNTISPIIFGTQVPTNNTISL